MHCFKCGNMLSDDSLFCQFCGADLNQQNTCSACGAALPEDGSFCTHCGQQRETSAASAKNKKKTNAFRVIAILIPLLFLFAAMILLIKPLSAPREKDELPTAIHSPATAAQSVLFLECYDSTGNLLSTGSGFLIEDGKTLVTNHHVINNVHSITAFDSKGEYAADVLQVLHANERKDLAVLELDRDTGLMPLPLGDSDLVSQGDAIYAIGYPLGMSNTLSDGIVSSRFTEDTVDILQITAPISPGSSGGALLDSHGQVIGVVYALYEDGQNMNLAVAANELRDLMTLYSIPFRLEELYHQLPPQLSLSDPGAELRYIWVPDEELACEIQFIWSELETTSLALDVLLEEYDGYEGCIGQDAPVYLLPGAFSEAFDTWCFDADRRFGDVHLMPEEEGYGLYFFCAAMEAPVEETSAEVPAPEQAPAEKLPEEAPQEVPVCTHIWSLRAVNDIPTCTSDGHATACCTLCRTWERRVLPALGHRYEDGGCVLCGATEPVYVPSVQTEPLPQKEEPPVTEESTPPTEGPSLTQDMLQGLWTCSGIDGVYGRSQNYTFYENHFYWKFWKGGINEGGEDAIESKRSGTFTIEGNTIYFSDGTVGTVSGNHMYIGSLVFYKPY